MGSTSPEFQPSKTIRKNKSSRALSVLTWNFYILPHSQLFKIWTLKIPLGFHQKCLKDEKTLLCKKCLRFNGSSIVIQVVLHLYKDNINMAIESNIKDLTHLLKINYYQENIKHLLPHYKLISSIRKFFKALNCLNMMMKSLQWNAAPQCLCLKQHTRVQEN